tara:strand:+ start:124 stop:483 length:360 start_codon:yes stop_codon:yes gene_type:complete
MPQEIQSEDFWTSVIKLNALSESKYKAGDYKGAIEEKRKAEIMLTIAKRAGKETKFIDLIKNLNKEKLTYDLIQDYKEKISHKKRNEIIKELKDTSEIKYISGDYKAAIKALRRAERYY